MRPQNKLSQTVKTPKPPPVMPEFAGLSKQQIVAELGKSPHGQLDVYLPLVKAATQDREFFAHLVTWNAAKGEVKDARVALPVISLLAGGHEEFMQNALANMAALDPRLFIRALKLAHAQKAPTRMLRRLVERRLKDLETDQHRWNRVAVQHRASLHYLYRRYHVDRPEFVARNIFEEERGTRLAPMPGSVFEAIQRLSTATPQEAAGLILKFKLPMLVIKGAMGTKAAAPEVGFALVGAMTPTELIHNTKDLEKNYGLRKSGPMRAAYEKAIEQAGVSRKGPTLKASRAAEALEEVDEVLATKMKALQEQKMEQITVDGNWLILGDKSGSMQHSITTTCEIAATQARSVKGTTHVVFFNTTPRYFDVTGKTLEEIQHLIRHMTAEGGTSIGCGVDYAINKGLDVDGIAIVSDGAEHDAPIFTEAYKRYTQKFGKEVPVYFYVVPGELNTLTDKCKRAGIDIQEFDLTKGKVDYYSLPNIVKTMRVSKYDLVDEIMRMPLLTLDEVLPRTKGQEVIVHAAHAASVSTP